MPFESPMRRQRDGPLPRCTAALRCASRGLQQAAFLRRCARKSATARALSLGRRRSTRACGVCAPRRAGWSRSLPYESPLRQRDGPLPRCTAALRRANRGLQHAAFLRRCARNNATARALSLGRRRSTRACGVCAPRRAGWSRSLPYESPLRQRDGPLPRCTAALRRANRGLQHAAFLRRCARNNATARALSLGRRRSTARLQRARAAPRWLESVPALWKPIAPARRPSPSVHGRAPTCHPRPPTSSFLAYVRKK